MYLPPSYEASPRARFPVIYLLHGFGATHLMWTGAHPQGLEVGALMDSLMDSLIAAGEVREMILVMPDASGPLGGSFYVMALDTAFVRAGIPHEFETFAGGHVGNVRARLATRVFPFFSRNLAFETPRE